MRTTVLTLSLTIAIFSSVEGRADDREWLAAGQSPEAWQDAPAVEEGPYSDLPAEGTSWIRPRYWFVPPRYTTYFQADALFLSRSDEPKDRAIGVSLPPGSHTVLSSDSAKLTNRFEPGMMFTLGFNLDQIGQIEATYWGLNTWRNSATATNSAGTLGLAGTLQNATTDFVFANRMSVDYVARVNNAEINYKQTINGITLLAGARYFRLVETFDINSQSSIFGTSSDYNVSAVNNLIGGQFGIGYSQDVGPFTLGVLGKIGPYANSVHQTTLVQDFGNTLIVRNYEKDGLPVSVLGEIQVNGVYRVTDWFSVHAGYRFIGITGLALAPDQLDLSNSPPGTRILNPHNHLILHGFNVGGEIRW